MELRIDIEAYKNHQEQNRKDIFTAGGICNNYADLDLGCNMLENEIQASLEQLL